MADEKKELEELKAKLKAAGEAEKKAKAETADYKKIFDKLAESGLTATELQKIAEAKKAEQADAAKIAEAKATIDQLKKLGVEPPAELVKLAGQGETPEAKAKAEPSFGQVLLGDLKKLFG